MKQGKALLINNIISLLLYGASSVLGTVLFVLIFSFLYYTDIPSWLREIPSFPVISVAILIPFAFCFFSGKWCLQKVENRLCFVSPLAFLLCSLCFDIYPLVFEKSLFEVSFLDFIVGILCGNSLLVEFLTVSHVENSFFLVGMGISILHYLLLVLGNMSGRKGSKRTVIQEEDRIDE